MKTSSNVHYPASSSTRKSLTTRYYQGENVEEAVIEAMWRLRLDYLTLKVTQEKDYEFFSEICRRPGTQLITFWDSEEKLQAFYTFRFHPLKAEGKRILLVHSKYYYVRPAFRGHPKIPASGWTLLPKMLFRHGLRRIYFVAFTFPFSYVSLTRTFGHSLTILDPATPAWEKQMLEEFTQEFSGHNWNSQRKVIMNQNIPIGEDRPTPPAVARLREKFDLYNPDWQKGNAMPIMMRFDTAMVKSVLGTSMRRLFRSS